MIQNKELIYVQIIIIVFSFIFLITGTQAQQLKLGNHPAHINSSAVLELESKNQGLLLSRIADTNNIVNPPDGMIIYFTDGATEEPYGAHAGVYERKNGSWYKPGIILDTAVDNGQSAIKFTRENGVYILHLPNATSGLRGVVSAGKQTFSGRKIFKDSITIEVLHPGSLLFAEVDQYGHYGLLTEDTSNLFWDNENNGLGIGTNNPAANLDVKGSFKLGETGSVLNSIIKQKVKTPEAVTLNGGEGHLYTFLSSSAKAGASVIASPAGQLPDGCVIAYAYSNAGYVFIKIQNSGSLSLTIPQNSIFYVTIIQ